jgi:hypothetical protein
MGNEQLRSELEKRGLIIIINGKCDGHFQLFCKHFGGICYFKIKKKYKSGKYPP